jgi:pimeloyl-ACP methyl ester carboxylesterase
MRAVEQRKINLHGQAYRYLTAGSGPLVVLLHGIAASAATWEHVIPQLSEQCRVIAPDLLGHGESPEPLGDYSLGAYANIVRDVLVELGEERATIVGHSLGGGVTMQFAYQYPERCERIVLVSSGGLGREVHPILRAATLPGAELVLPWLSVTADHGIGLLLKIAQRFGLRESADLEETWRSFVALETPKARRTFLQTVREVIDSEGQRISALDRIYVCAGVPTLIVWGEKDPLVPVSHAYRAHELIEGSRLEIFEGAGHYPYLEDPQRFANTLLAFVRTTMALSAERYGTRRSRVAVAQTCVIGSLANEGKPRMRRGASVRRLLAGRVASSRAARRHPRCRGSDRELAWSMPLSVDR